MNRYRLAITRNGIPCLYEFHAHTPEQASDMAVALYPGAIYGKPRELGTGSYSRNHVDSEHVFRQIVNSGFGELVA